MHWSSSGISNAGVKRKLNEDAFLDKPESGIWVVADGMGGHDAGDYASSLIVEVLADIKPQANLNDLVDAVIGEMKAVNATLLKEAKRRELSIIGSTVLIVVAYGSDFACIWAGDSRLYRLRKGAIEQLSRDHSQVQLLVDQGKISKDEAEGHPSANVVTRAVGALEELQLEKVYGEIKSGDKFLLCSDGLYKEVTEQEMAESLNNNSEPSAAIQKFLHLALERGARDNLAIVAVTFGDNH